MINEIKFKRDTAFRQDMFTPESFAHPAKMDSQLFIWIVEKFTQLGDTILDPMAGSGTALLACMMGRNVILVELEEKFCDMMTGYDCSGKVIKSEVIHHEGIEAGWWCKSGSYEGSIRWDTKEAAIEFLKTDGYTEGEIDECELYYDPTVTPPHDEIKIITQCGKNKEHKAHHVLGNWELIKQKPQLGCQMGEATIIHGDSRNLKGLLCDKIITSPPFVGITAWQDADFQKKVSEKYGQRNWSSNGQGQDNPSNIANLKYGDIDKIITSPPYANQAIGDKGGGIDWDKSNKPITEGRIGSLCKEYSDNPSNIGNLPYGNIDKIITSPPFGDSEHNYNHGLKVLGENFKGRKAWENKGSIDKIITSPPYSTAGCKGDENPANYIRREQERLKKFPKRPKTFVGRYGEGWDNIGNLPYGNIDTVITSPPHGDSDVGKGIRPNRWEKVKDLEGFNGRKDWKSGTPSEYSKDKGNIANLKYGEIDKIITSPPYEDKVAAADLEFYKKKCIQTGRNPNSPHAQGISSYTDKIDHIITSPPYEGSLTGSSDEDRAKEFERMRALGLKINPNSADQKVRGAEYSDDKSNIGNLKSQSYLDAMKIVYSECFKVLKPGGLMILVTKNFIRNQKEIRLDLDTIKLCEQSGFTFLDRWYRKLHAQSFWRIIYKKKFPDAPSLDFEDVLVFKK